MRKAIEVSRQGTDESAVAAAAIAEASSGVAASTLACRPSSRAGPGPRSATRRGPAASTRRATYSHTSCQVWSIRYCAALFRVGTVGTPGDDAMREAAIVREALENVIAAIRPGVTSEAVHGVSKKTFEKHQYGHRLAHRTGYSIGINFAPDWGRARS